MTEYQPSRAVGDFASLLFAHGANAGFCAGSLAPWIRQSRRPIDVRPGNFRINCGAGTAVVGLN